MKNKFNDALAFGGRVLVAAIFIYGGIIKSTGYAQFAQLMSAHHVSGHLLPLVVLLEFGGGLALIFGVLTRVVAAVLAVYSAVAIVIFLLPPANSTMLTLIFAEIGMIGGLLSYVAFGAGRFSVDRVWFKKSSSR